MRRVSKCIVKGCETDATSTGASSYMDKGKKLEARFVLFPLRLLTNHKTVQDRVVTSTAHTNSMFAKI